MLARCTAKTEGMKTGAGHADGESFAARARSALGTVLRGPLTGFVDEDGSAWEDTSSTSQDGNSGSQRNPSSDKEATAGVAVSDIYEVEFVLTAGDIGASSKALTGGKGGKGGKQPTASSIVVTVKEQMQRQFIVSPALAPETLAALEKMGEEAARPQEVKPKPTNAPSLEQLAKQASADKGKGAVATTNTGATSVPSTSAPATTQPAALTVDAKGQGLSGKGTATSAPVDASATKTQTPTKDPAAAAGAVAATPGSEIAAKVTNAAAPSAPKDKPPQSQPESELVRGFFVARVPTCATTLLTLHPSTPAPDGTLSQLSQSSRAGTSNASSSSSSSSSAIVINPTTAAGLYCIGQLSCLKTVNSASGKDPSLASSQQVYSVQCPLTQTSYTHTHRRQPSTILSYL